MPQDPFIKCFCLFTCTFKLIEGRIIFDVVDLLSLKLSIFRLIISERSECTILHLFFSKISWEIMLPDPLAQVSCPILTGLHAHSL